MAFLVEAILIGALDNQGLLVHMVNYQGKHPDSFLGRSVSAWLTFTWRFTPSSGDKFSHHLWWGELGTLLTVFVVTALLVLAVVRGPITFGRVFFGTWMAVVVASLLSRFVALLINPYLAPPEGSRFLNALFGGPSGYTFVAGLGLGFIVALIAALVGIATRRAPAPAFAPAGAGFAPGQGDGREGVRDEEVDGVPRAGEGLDQDRFFGAQTARHAAPSSPAPEDRPSLQKDAPPAAEPGTERLPNIDEIRGSAPSGSGAPSDSEATSQFPAIGNPDQATTVHPRFPGGGDSATTQLPRFPGPETDEPANPPTTESSPTESSSQQAGQPAGQQAGQQASQQAGQPAGESTPEPPRPSDDRPTTQFPRPPDDEDLGQHPE